VDVPEGLGEAGAALWSSVMGTWVLRPDEERVLEKACRTADDSARLDAEVAAGPLLVTGSMGQQRANPLLAEARATRALLAALLKQLALPDEQASPTAKSGMRDTTSRAIKAAGVRWGHGG
jgi:hypothetical protein